MTLNVNLGSGYKYSVPTFKPHATTPEVYWPYFSALLARAKRQITAPPASVRKKEGGMLSAEDTPPQLHRRILRVKYHREPPKLPASSNGIHTQSRKRSNNGILRRWPARPSSSTE
jgi:hypothetical protein